MERYIIYNTKTTEPIQTIEAENVMKASAYAGRWYGERMEDGEVDICEKDWFWSNVYQEL